MSRRRSSPAPAPPLDDEDLLEEVLLRLPPQPSSLPRASLVCKRWRSILTDTRFLGRFRKHHQKPPLLGFLAGPVSTTPIFTSVLESPDRIPHARFSVPQNHQASEQWRFMGCRHGLAVLVNPARREIAVWDPLTGGQNHVTFPPGLDYKGATYFIAAVMCADAQDGHVHGDCFSSPFKLALLCLDRYTPRALGWLYESAFGEWGNVVFTPTTDRICHIRPSVLVGNVLCWLLYRGDILAFDVERKSLDVIKKPEDAHTIDYYWHVQLLRTEHSALGFTYLSELTVQIWERRSSFDGVPGWVLLHKTILLEAVLPRRVRSGYRSVSFMGYDEDTNAIVLITMIGDFMLQLDSMQIRRIVGREKICYNIFYPYTNFYTAGFQS